MSRIFVLSSVALFALLFPETPRLGSMWMDFEPCYSQDLSFTPISWAACQKAGGRSQLVLLCSCLEAWDESEKHRGARGEAPGLRHARGIRREQRESEQSL